MAGKRDYYEALGVDRKATAEEIRRAYRRLARTCHPDVSDAPDAAARFAEITEANETLADAEKRRAYDRFGHAAATAGFRPRPGGGPGGGPTVDFDIGSIFEEMFGERGASPFTSPRRAPPGRGRDVERTITTGFLTAALGGDERLRIAAGEGERARTVHVRIPPGLEPGSRLRLRGRGDPGPPGGRPGDLILTVEVGGHPWFRREGRHVLIDVPVTFAEATLGATVRVPLLRGSASIRIPPGASSGQRLRIPEKGVTGEDGRAGDFFAVVRIVAPTELSDHGLKLVEELAGELQNPRDSGPWADRGEDGVT